MPPKKQFKRRMTRTQYANEGGLICPFCGSANIEGGPFAVDAPGVASQEIGCLACNSAWWDQYRLVGYGKKGE